MRDLTRLLWFLFCAAALAQPAPVAVRLKGQALFELKAPPADHSLAEGAALIGSRLEAVAANRAINSDDLFIVQETSGSAIRAGDQLLVLVTPAEAAAHGRDRAQLASEWLRLIRAAIAHHRETTSLRFWVWLAVYFLLYTLLFAGVVWALNWLHRAACAASRRVTEIYSRRSDSRLQNLLSPATIVNAWATAVSVGRWLLTLIAFNFYLTYSVRLFPGTNELSSTLGSYLLSPIYDMASAIGAYLPNLFSVLLIALLSHYLIRLSNFFFIKVARGAIDIGGFYPDWALPTAKLVRFFIIVMALIAAFPYLPGSHTPAFQGISIFVGVLFSFGSSSTIANIVSGVILTYMRAFQVGDRVKIADTIGNVMEKNLLVTRVRTIRNEVVTIPNSLIMAAQILNYSVLARERRLILYTGVTIGYGNQWQTIHNLLLAAGRATKGVEQEPAPYVWQRRLNDYNVSYELNVYTADADGMFDTYSELHGRIQDAFRDAGVEILSPAYTALRDGNDAAIPSPDGQPRPATGGFRVASSAG